MADPQTYPPGAYVAVRRTADAWAAVVAHEARVIVLAEVETRSEAFEMAERKAAYEGLPCLISRRAA
jgi:hypothetical protein